MISQIENRPVSAEPKWTDNIPWFDILGIRISSVNLPLAVSTIESWIESDHRDYACLCNIHSALEANDNSVVQEAINRAGLRCPDGKPMVWLSKLKGDQEVGHIRGGDLMLQLCSRSASTGHRHFFYGSQDDVLVQLCSNLQRRFPGLEIAGSYSPGRLNVGELEEPEILARINASRPDVLWVSLGCPKQEVWSALHRPLLDCPVIIPVGAAFDFHSGARVEAPEWMQSLGLEWAHRLLSEPRRLSGRYVKSASFAGRYTLQELRNSVAARKDNVSHNTKKSP